MRPAVPLTVLVAAFFGIEPTNAAQVQIIASRDATLYEDAEGDLANGAGEFIFAGRTGQPTGSLRRALVWFDVAGAIPSGSRIDSVTLTLHCSIAVGGPRVLSLFRVMADWGEGASDATGAEGPGTAAMDGDATWLHTSYPLTLWSTPGGEFEIASSGDATVDLAGVSYAWGSTTPMVADVQSWLDAPSGNFGWIIVGDESLGGTAKRFDSRENAVAAFRPTLAVDFTYPPGDMNCDGQVDDSDAAPLASAILDPAGFIGCDVTRADCNGDGAIDGADIGAFLRDGLP